MTQARIKLIWGNAFYHCYNRVSGKDGYYPFDDVSKEHGFKLIEELGNYFTVETISATIMSNHFHIVVYAPKEIPTANEAAERHNAYHNLTDPDNVPNGKIYLDPTINPEKCNDIARQMVDISCFMKIFQQRFTSWYNKTNNSTGSIWGGRFKSTLLEGTKEALWNCVKYVELNPVRAKLVEDSANYRFCSWGRFSGCSKHPFADHFIKHMRSINARKEVTDGVIYDEFRGELAAAREWDATKDAEKARRAGERARIYGDSMPVRFMRRTRHIVDGGVIGSKTFIREMASQFDDPGRIERKQLSRGDTPDGVIYCLKRLKV